MNAPRVVVTGAGGYIGRHVVAALTSQGAGVTAVVRREPWQPFPDSVRTVIADILDDDFDVTTLGAEAPDAVVHLAWQDGFAHNAASHMLYLSAHFRLLERFADWGVARLSILGSMHEIGYWEGAIGPDTPANPLSLYGIAKNALRQAAFAHLTNKVTVQWLRCYYIYGDDRANRSVFTKLLEAADRGQETFPFTSGVAKYDFIEVDELGRQIAAVALSDAEGIFECSSGEPVALGDKVLEFIERHHLPITLEFGAFPDRPYDSPAVWGDASRIREVLRA